MLAWATSTVTHLWNQTLDQGGCGRNLVMYRHTGDYYLPLVGMSKTDAHRKRSPFDTFRYPRILYADTNVKDWVSSTTQVQDSLLKYSFKHTQIRWSAVFEKNCNQVIS